MTRVDVHTIRREQILDVAALLIEEHGWAGVTFAAICRAAHVTNGVLTYHFKDKDDLLFALFERTIRRWRDEVWGRPRGRDESFEERVAAGVHQMIQRGSERREFRLLSFHFLSLATERPDIAARMHALQREMLAKMTEELRAEAARGAVRRDPEEAAAVVLSIVMGFGFMRKAFDVDVPEGALVEILTMYLTHSPSVSAGEDTR